MNAIPLGKLWGEAEFELILDPGCLPTTESTDFGTDLQYAATAGGAISYPDGHPSEDAAPSLRVKSAEDKKLRRFASLSWIIHVCTNGSWYKTGHVLVMDMDQGRQHHPWIVLASGWPNEEENGDGEFTTYAKTKVVRDDSSQPGVLPGDRNRTPVAKLEAMDNSNDEPFIRRFGPGFEIHPIRFGGERSYDKKSSWGPDLPHTMDWYWDPVDEKEVCFGKNYKEYMRYDQQTKQYTYPNMADLLRSAVGEVGMFGELTPVEFTGSISIVARLGNLEVQSEDRSHEDASSTSGF